MLVLRTILTLVVSGLLSQGAFAAETKIGYVDLQKAIQMTKEGKKAKKTLEKAFNKKKKELQKEEDLLKKMSADLEKKKLILSEDVKLKKQQELQQSMLKYREMVGNSQLEIQNKERELTKPILEKLQKVLAKVAKKDGYSMVLEKSEQSVLWAKEELNLTDKLVKEFDKK